MLLGLAWLGLAWLGLAWLARDVPFAYLSNLFEISKLFYRRDAESLRNALAQKQTNRLPKLCQKTSETHWSLHCAVFFQKQIYLSSPFFIETSLRSHSFISIKVLTLSTFKAYYIRQGMASDR